MCRAGRAIALFLFVGAVQSDDVTYDGYLLVFNAVPVAIDILATYDGFGAGWCDPTYDGTVTVLTAVPSNSWAATNAPPFASSDASESANTYYCAYDSSGSYTSSGSFMYKWISAETFAAFLIVSTKDTELAVSAETTEEAFDSSTSMDFWIANGIDDATDVNPTYMKTCDCCGVCYTTLGFVSIGTSLVESECTDSDACIIGSDGDTFELTMHDAYYDYTTYTMVYPEITPPMTLDVIYGGCVCCVVYEASSGDYNLTCNYLSPFDLLPTASPTATESTELPTVGSAVSEQASVPTASPTTTTCCAPGQVSVGVSLVIPKGLLAVAVFLSALLLLVT